MDRLWNGVLRTPVKVAKLRHASGVMAVQLGLEARLANSVDLIGWVSPGMYCCCLQKRTMIGH